jgi:hypothetical protein
MNFETEQTSPEEIAELSFSDKFVGVFTEPSATFENISKFKIKTIDWLIPLLISCVIIAAGNVIRMSNPAIKSSTIEMTRAQQEKQLAKYVQEKKITQEQADKQIEQTEKFMATPLYLIIASGGAIIGMFVFFFVFAFVYFIFGKFVFRGTGTFASALPALGLTQLIAAISSILAIILSVVYSKTISDGSIASIINFSQISSPLYLILGILDVFMIWATVAQSIGLSKMYKTKSYIPFLIVGLAILIIFKFIAFMALK